MFNKTEIYEAVIGINPGYYQKGKEVNGYIFNFDAISQICQNIFNSNHIKVDGTSALSNVIDLEDTNDNAFAKSTYNLNHIAANANSAEFNSQMDSFDEELSSFIIENDKYMKDAEAMAVNMQVLPSQNPPCSPIIFMPVSPVTFV